MAFLILVSGKSVNAVDTGGGRTTAADFLDDGCGVGDVNIWLGTDGGGGGGGFV